MRDKSEAPARFFVRVGGKVRGPYSRRDLEDLPGFGGDTLLCPERRNFRSRWNWAPARTFPGLLPAAGAPPEGWWTRFAERWHRPRPAPLIKAAGLVVAAVLAWMHFVYLPQVRQTYQRVHTSMGLIVIAGLQERYRKETGAYAPDFDSLAEAAGDWLPRIMADNMDLKTLLVKGTSDHFTLEANALDERRTLYRFEAAAPRRQPVGAPEPKVAASSGAAVSPAPAAPPSASTAAVPAGTP